MQTAHKYEPRTHQVHKNPHIRQNTWASELYVDVIQWGLNFSSSALKIFVCSFPYFMRSSLPPPPCRRGSAGPARGVSSYFQTLNAVNAVNAGTRICTRRQQMRTEEQREEFWPARTEQERQKIKGGIYSKSDLKKKAKKRMRRQLGKAICKILSVSRALACLERRVFLHNNSLVP